MDEFAKTPTDLSIGNVWNGYEIIGKIGSGGMGVVYKAIQKNPQRTVAIKIDSSAKENNSRFTREVQIAAKLDHPNIGRIYDAGAIAQYRYMVMEFIDGQPLNVYLQNNHLPLEDKMAILIQLCSALGYAHRKGIVHRDLKPANILIKKNSTPVIIDFGLAKRINNNEEFDLTKTGDILGTPNYMAPEQVAGKGSLIHQQTDVYAMGAIFYEVISGERMISGDGTLEILFKIQHETIPAPSQINSLLDRRLDIIWEKATARQQDYRYKNISMFGNDLKLFLHNKNIKVNRTVVQRFKWQILLGLFICIVVGFMIFSTNKDTRVRLSKKELKIQRHVNAIIQHIHNRQFQNAKQQMRTISKYLKEGYKVLIAKAYYEKGRPADARRMLEKFPQRAEYRYYNALSYYSNKNYDAAIPLLSEPLGISSYDFHRKYYLAKSLYNKAATITPQQKTQVNALYTRSLEILLTIENHFSEDIKFLELMADIYYFFRNYKKAEYYLQQCVEQKPLVAVYSTRLSQIYLDSGKYYDAFLLARKVLYVNNDLDAAEILHEIPYHNPELREQCYQALTYKFLKESIMPCPDLLRDDWKNLQQNYHILYLGWLQGQKQIDEKTFPSRLKNFINRFHHLPKSQDLELQHEQQNTMHKVLHSLRYNNLEQQLKLLKDNIPKNWAKNIATQVKKITRIRYREQCAMIFYQLLYAQQNNIWSHNPFTAEYLKLLLYMLKEECEKTNIHEKYLLAKGCLYFEGLESLFNILHNPKTDIITRIAIAAVLRENFLPVELPLEEYTSVDFKLSKEEDEFLKILIARSLYTSHRRKPNDYTFRKQKMLIADNEKKFLYALMQEENTQRVQVVAAASLYCLLQLNNDNVLLEKSIQFLLDKGIFCESSSIRQYAHYMFWVKKHIHKGNIVPHETLIKIFRRGINDTDANVKEIVFSFGAKLETILVDEVMKDIEKCLRSEETLKVRFRAMFAYSIKNSTDKFIFSEDTQPLTVRALEKSATFIFNFYRVFLQLKNKSDINIRRLFSVKKSLSLIKQYFHHLPKSSQCMISYQLSLFGVHFPLQKVRDQKVLCYLLYQLHQELNFDKNKQILQILAPKNRSQRRQMAKEFLKHPNIDVRRAAIVAYISLGSFSQLQTFYDKHHTDTSIHQEIAQGIYLFMQNYWIRNTQEKDSLKFADVFSWKTDDEIYYQKLKKMRKFFEKMREKKPDKAQKFIYFFDKICELSPQNSDFLLAKALFNFNKTSFIDDISNVIKCVHQKIKNENYNYIDYQYLLNALEIIQDKKINITNSWNRALDPNILSGALLPELGRYYTKSGQYSQALRAYQKNFLERIDDFSPFKDAKNHWAMIDIALKSNNTELAKQLFASLYQLYWREQEAHSETTKKNFLRRIQKDYPDIHMHIDKQN